MTRYQHYFRDVSHLEGLDIYRILALYEVTDPAIQHAVKKLLCAGSRGVKDRERDYREAVDSINRALEMIEEDEAQDMRHLNLGPDHMVVCSICGDKRCPKAKDHRVTCAGSNEVTT